MTTVQNIESLLYNSNPLIKGTTLAIIIDTHNQSFYVSFDLTKNKINNISYFIDNKQCFLSEETKQFVHNYIIEIIKSQTPQTYSAIVTMDIYANSKKEADFFLENIVTELKIKYDNNPVGQFLHVKNKKFDITYN